MNFCLCSILPLNLLKTEFKFRLMKLVKIFTHFIDLIFDYRLLIFIINFFFAHRYGSIQHTNVSEKITTSRGLQARFGWVSQFNGHLSGRTGCIIIQRAHDHVPLCRWSDMRHKNRKVHGFRWDTLLQLFIRSTASFARLIMSPINYNQLRSARFEERVCQTKTNFQVISPFLFS